MRTGRTAIYCPGGALVGHSGRGRHDEMQPQMQGMPSPHAVLPASVPHGQGQAGRRYAQVERVRRMVRSLQFSWWRTLSKSRFEVLSGRSAGREMQQDSDYDQRDDCSERHRTAGSNAQEEGACLAQPVSEQSGETVGADRGAGARRDPVSHPHARMDGLRQTNQLPQRPAGFAAPIQLLPGQVQATV